MPEPGSHEKDAEVLVVAMPRAAVGPCEVAGPRGRQVGRL